MSSYWQNTCCVALRLTEGLPSRGINVCSCQLMVITISKGPADVAQALVPADGATEGLPVQEPDR